MTPPTRHRGLPGMVGLYLLHFALFCTWKISQPGRRGGAPRSESAMLMIAGGNHTIIHMSPPYNLLYVKR